MPGRPFVKRQYQDFYTIDKLKRVRRFEYMDAGEMEVVASYLEIPDGTSAIAPLRSQSYKFGCLPWHLELTRQVRSNSIIGNGKLKQIIKVSLVCSYNESEWTAKASGTLTMKKWREKLPKGTDMSKLEEHNDKFAHKFNHSKNAYIFIKEFPLAGTGTPTSDPNLIYIKNRQIKFRLEFILHSARKSYFPFYDFSKSTPSTNAVIKVGSDGKHKFHVNTEFLSMYSEGFERMFNSEGFREQRTKEVELKSTTPDVFREFLGLVYPSHKRPTVKNLRGLLELARMFFIPTITGLCEQRLLQTNEAEMPMGERLKLADEYGLLQLKANIMQKTDPSALSDIQGLREDTLSMLVRKLQQQRERQLLQQQRREEPMEVDGQRAQASTSRHRSQHNRHGRGGAGGSNRHRNHPTHNA